MDIGSNLLQIMGKARNRWKRNCRRERNIVLRGKSCCRRRSTTNKFNLTSHVEEFTARGQKESEPKTKYWHLSSRHIPTAPSKSTKFCRHPSLHRDGPINQSISRCLPTLTKEVFILLSRYRTYPPQARVRQPASSRKRWATLIFIK